MMMLMTMMWQYRRIVRIAIPMTLLSVLLISVFPVSCHILYHVRETLLRIDSATDGHGSGRGRRGQRYGRRMILFDRRIESRRRRNRRGGSGGGGTSRSTETLFAFTDLADGGRYGTGIINIRHDCNSLFFLSFVFTTKPLYYLLGLQRGREELVIYYSFKVCSLWVCVLTVTSPFDATRTGTPTNDRDRCNKSTFNNKTLLHEKMREE